MKKFILLLILLSGCKNGPQIDQGILTIHDCDQNHRCIVESDFIKPDNSLYELNGEKLDGYYLMSPSHRKTLLNWAKQNCSYGE